MANTWVDFSQFCGKNPNESKTILTIRCDQMNKIEFKVEELRIVHARWKADAAVFRKILTWSSNMFEKI